MLYYIYIYTYVIYIYMRVCAWVDPYSILPMYVIIHLILCKDWSPRSAKEELHSVAWIRSSIHHDTTTVFSDKVSNHSSYLEGIPKLLRGESFFLGWCSQAY